VISNFGGYWIDRVDMIEKVSRMIYATNSTQQECMSALDSNAYILFVETPR